MKADTERMQDSEENRIDVVFKLGNMTVKGVVGAEGVYKHFYWQTVESPLIWGPFASLSAAMEDFARVAKNVKTLELIEPKI